MPDFSKHVEQAKHNKEISKLLNTTHKSKFNDWVVTTCFYASVHMVEAMINESDHLLVPASAFPMYSEQRKLVKRPGVKHSSDLEDDYAKCGHELRNSILIDNKWFFKRVGVVCSTLRSMSQSARYDCQTMNDEDADSSEKLLYCAIVDFNSWAIQKGLPTI